MRQDHLRRVLAPLLWLLLRQLLWSQLLGPRVDSSSTTANYSTQQQQQALYTAGSLGLGWARRRALTKALNGAR